MDCFLSELLCYDISEKKFGELQRSLKEYQLLLAVLDESIDAFEKGELEKFDSLVGENACQIRAIRIAFIHSVNSINYKKLKLLISRSRNIINEILSGKKIATLMTDGISLKEVLESYQLDLPLNSDEVFALKSFLLTEMKEVVHAGNLMPSLARKSRCTPVKIKRFDSDISYTFTNRLASHVRQRLSVASVKFVRDIAIDLKDSELIRMVSDDFTILHNSLHCIPMFWTYKILLKSAKKRGIPLIIHIKFVEQKNDGYHVTNEEKLFFNPVETLNGIRYQEASPNEIDLQKAACVVQGVACTNSEWDKSNIVHSIIDTILAGAADHRQYPNPDVQISVNDPEFEQFKLMALDKGFSSENPTSFFIQHVYPIQVRTFFG